MRVGKRVAGFWFATNMPWYMALFVGLTSWCVRSVVKESRPRLQTSSWEPNDATKRYLERTSLINEEAQKQNEAQEEEEMRLMLVEHCKLAGDQATWDLFCGLVGYDLAWQTYRFYVPGDVS